MVIVEKQGTFWIANNSSNKQWEFSTFKPLLTVVSVKNSHLTLLKSAIVLRVNTYVNKFIPWWHHIIVILDNLQMMMLKKQLLSSVILKISKFNLIALTFSGKKILPPVDQIRLLNWGCRANSLQNASTKSFISYFKQCQY